MPISDTRIWVGAQRLTAPQMNDSISTVEDDLAGRNGVIEFEDSLSVEDGADGDRYILLPKGTTAQQPTNPVRGMLRFDTTTEKLSIGKAGLFEDVRDEPLSTANIAGLLGTTATTIARGNHTH